MIVLFVRFYLRDREFEYCSRRRWTAKYDGWLRWCGREWRRFWFDEWIDCMNSQLMGMILELEIFPIRLKYIRKLSFYSVRTIRSASCKYKANYAAQALPSQLVRVCVLCLWPVPRYNRYYLIRFVAECFNVSHTKKGIRRIRRWRHDTKTRVIICKWFDSRCLKQSINTVLTSLICILNYVIYWMKRWYISPRIYKTSTFRAISVLKWIRLTFDWLVWSLMVECKKAFTFDKPFDQTI